MEILAAGLISGDNKSNSMEESMSKETSGSNRLQELALKCRAATLQYASPW